MKKLVKKNVFRFCILLGLLCVLPAPTLCDTPPQDSFAWIKLPTLTAHTSQKCLDEYVQGFQHQGFVVVSRQQKFSKTGNLSYFHFRAVHPPEDPSPGNTGKSVEILWTPTNRTESFAFGSRTYRTGPDSWPLKTLRPAVPATPAVPAEPGG